MSKLTETLIAVIDYEYIKQKRRKNYLYLYEQLLSINTLNPVLSNQDIPMVYPFLPMSKGEQLKKKLIDNCIYVATYWNGQKDTEFGKELEKNLLALPIDQRYDLDDMKKIIEVLNG